ncbi:MAG: SPOR domain-containing protein [Deltaproteobacteria bacterium]|nr:SPOR domain-containing protein [Deltaproteobacteria bacterium]
MTSVSLFLWGFCLCFLLAWIFVLGVLVGRGFLPSAVSTISDLKSQIARLQGLVTHGKKLNSVPQKGGEADPKLAFYEKLSSKKEEVKKKGPPEKKVENPQGQPAPVRPEKVPKGAAQVRKEQEAPVAGSDVQFTVQLASLEDRAKAESMIKDLRDKGFDGYFYEVRIKGRTFYRVRCGKFKDREGAGAHARRLAEQAGIHGFVSKID